LEEGEEKVHDLRTGGIMREEDGVQVLIEVPQFRTG